ncbi:MAG: hypothetical protein IT161_14610 [Bryobacterales bacterium]|nr:hypothetical protein [Bryobacterales bacterium]
MTLLLCLAAALAPQGGVLPEWEARKLVDKVMSDIAKIQPMFEQLDPSRWQDKSAGAVYTPYWKGAQAETKSVEITGAKFTQQPERLTTGLDFLYRLDSLHSQVSLLSQGIRRYQNAALADLLDAAMREAASSRDAVRQHVYDLAALREKELEVASNEAQRCRAQLAKPGSTPKGASGR